MTTDPLASGYNPHPAKGLKTPRAAAAAGILFSVLLLTSLFLILDTVRLDPRDPGKHE